MTEQFILPEHTKAYFISDAHLGSLVLNDDKERERLLVSWLEDIRKDAGLIFLLGDIFDFWFEYKNVIPRGYTRLLGKIAEIADSGIPIHFFTGNHDIWIFDYLPSELGITVHHKEMKATISGKKFFMAHGDLFDQSERKTMKKMFRNRFFQKCFAALHPRIGISIGRKWSKNSRLKHDDISDNEREGLLIFAQSLLAQEDFDYFVFGHKHKVINTLIDKKTHFIMLGDWVRHFSYGVFDGKNFEIGNYRK